jgi:hypothetical protein
VPHRLCPCLLLANVTNALLGRDADHEAAGRELAVLRYVMESDP